MGWRLVRAVIILPGTVLVFVPGAILLGAKGTPFSAGLASPMDVSFWLALAVASPGLWLAVWSASLITRIGEGTPAPWDPARKLVILGPYRCVRNPMITGVLLLLLAEVILFDSWLLFLWAIFFLCANLVYLPLIEERGLKRRFGEAYLEYVARVPRWIPRIQTWIGENDKKEVP